MPLYIFTCDNEHKVERFRSTPFKRIPRTRCKKCGLILRIDYMAQAGARNHITHVDQNNEPISHLLNKRSTKGHWVENLTPQPVFVQSQAQYQSLLRKTNSREVTK